MTRTIFATLVLLGGCGLSGVDGNGQRVTELRTLSGFSEVRSDGSLDVAVHRGDAFRVEVSIDSNLVPLVQTEVVGDTLRIDADRIGDSVGGPHVLVTMPTLRRATLSGSGALAATGFQEAAPVALGLDGSGDLAFTGEAARLDVRVEGSGATRLQGTAAELAVALDGSGSVDARDLIATTAELAVRGSGDVTANVTGQVRVSLSGSGSVDLYGGAQLERVDVSGSGELRRH